jgi:hypothetical protein
MFQSSILTGFIKQGEEIGSSDQASSLVDARDESALQEFFPASKDGLALATSLELKTNAPAVLILAGTNPDFPITALVKDLGRSLVERGASDVLLLDFCEREMGNGVRSQSPFERILSAGSRIDDMFDQALPGLYVLASQRISVDRSLPIGESVKAVFDSLRRRFRYVLIATPAYVQNNRARLLARQADGIILGIQQGQQGRALLRQIQQDLKSDGSVSLGFILSNGAQK